MNWLISDGLFYITPVPRAPNRHGSAPPGGNGHKVAWINAEGNPDKSALDTMYAQPKA
jgi:hypothetical protein